MLSALSPQVITAQNVLDLPYTQDFNSEGCFDGFTVLNLNGDNYQWEWNKYDYPRQDESCARLHYGSSRHDDWLITPGFNLKAGQYYEVSFDVYAQNARYPEEMEVFAGAGNTADAMTIELVAATIYDNDPDNIKTVTKMFTVPTDGVYHIGFHGITSDDKAYFLNVDNIKLAKGISAGAPAAVTGLTVTPGEHGALTARIDFTAPTTLMDGGELTSLSRVEIQRGGIRIGEVSPVPAPGETATFTDPEAPHGENTYTVIPFNGDSPGEPASATRFIGVSKPLQVNNVKVSRGADTGELIVTWERVTRDINGMELLDDQVTYDVYRIEDEHQRVIASETNSCEVTERLCAPDAPQQFVIYQVKAFTRYGSADETESYPMPVGQAATLPFIESVADGHLSQDWAQQLPEENGEYWQNVPDGYIDGINSADEDGGYLAMVSSFTGYEGTLISGNIDIPAEIANPGLSFYYWNYASGNYIDVMVNEGEGFTKLLTVALDGSDAQDGWARKVITLDAYKGKTIQVAFRGVIAQTNLLALDAITIDRLPGHDLTARELMMPQTVKTNEPFTITVKVENVGSLKAEDYTVTIYRDNVAVATKPGEPVEPSTSCTLTFDTEVGVFSDSSSEFHAEVDYADDEVPGNNTSRTAFVDILLPSTPVVNDLSATLENATVRLTWSQPDLESVVPEGITDGVEEYVPFSIGLPTSVLETDDMGQWSVIDGDGATTYVLTGNPFPNSGNPMSFVVFNATVLGIQGTHSGHQMFMSFNPYDMVSEQPVKTDDWLISPELYGGAQTVKFFARSMQPQFLETMEMWYSLGGRDREDFIKAGEIPQVAADWTEYSFDVPEGAKHFALRNVSYDMFALCIDDISYIPVDPVSGNLTIDGYNIYRDKVRLNTEPVTETAYTDLSPLSGDHTYHVTIAYTSGESTPSNAARVSSSVDNVSATGTSVRITGGHGAITIDGACGVKASVHTLDGRSVASVNTNGKTVITASPGIYIVKAGDAAAKVIVR